MNRASTTVRRLRPRLSDVPDALWYKSAIIYELHVRAFRDSTSDGVGDFNGLISKLDYLQDLGVTAIWLLPFYPSPLKDDGYDIADYLEVHPSYGTLADVRRFVAEAHARNLRVITELVINHTSDQHPWFQRARRAPKGSTYRDFYVWSDSPQKYKGTRIIFKDFEPSNWSWDPVAQQYYWHRFYHHQPDLNFDNPAVHDAVFKACDFWLRAGVDGMRLDAVPYLFEREGTSCENLPETHEFLKKLRAHIDARFPGRMLLAEANQWPEDAIAYFGAGDESHMCFHFPLMPRLFMALRMEDRFPIIDILQQTPPIPENCQWALFLRNHDELTLEMVTDEERDYMYRVYASDQEARINLGIRRRLAPLLNNNRRKIELLNALLFSMPGTPVIYYGDEIGMGDNVYLGDRDGVRTPMQWSADRNAGFSSANPQKLYLPVIIDPEYHYETLNVEAQLSNASSLLWWMKRLIALRKRHPVFGNGDIRFLTPSNGKILAFVRSYQDEKVLVAANLSRFAQPAEIDLSDYQGMTPVEMFGQTQFPVIGPQKYCLPLGPHSFYWFTLRAPVAVGTEPLPVQRRVPEIAISSELSEWLVSDDSWPALEAALLAYLPQRQWFASKARSVRAAHVLDVIPLQNGRGRVGRGVGNAAAVAGTSASAAFVLLVTCEYIEGESDVYAIALVAAPLMDDAHAHAVAHGVADEPEARLIVLRRSGRAEAWVLRDAPADPAFAPRLIETIARSRAITSARGETRARRTEQLTERSGDLAHLPLREFKTIQDNSIVFVGDRLVLKLVRRVEEGINPDLEIGLHLHRVEFPHAPRIVGFLEYRRAPAPPRTIALAWRFIPNQGDVWSYTLDELDRYFEQAMTHREVTDAWQQMASDYPRSVELLGARTAEMHAALADDRGDPAFAAEPFTLMYQRSLLQSMRNVAQRALHAVRTHLAAFDEPSQELARQFLAREADLVARFRPLTQSLIGTQRVRCHGDYHLGQVLWTGKDFCIIDFEGAADRPLGERRLKRTPLRDVASMLRSFDRAAAAALHRHAERGAAPTPEAKALLRQLAAEWTRHVRELFQQSYLRRIRELNAPLVPADDAHLRLLLRVWLIETVLHELLGEFDARAASVELSLRALIDLLSESPG